MPTPRRFTLLDVMIVVGAVALATAGTRWQYAGYAWFWNLDREGWTPVATLHRLAVAMALALPALFAATVAVVLARLARPRPPLRRVALQPGSAACGMALLAVAAETVGYVVRQAHYWISMGHPWSSFRSWIEAYGLLGAFTSGVLIRTTYAAAYAVLATWALLTLSRRGHPEPSWVDRSGRALAAAWVLTAFLFWLDRNFLKGGIPGSLGSPY
jgi:hypothetical protein